MMVWHDVAQIEAEGHYHPEMDCSKVQKLETSSMFREIFTLSMITFLFVITNPFS